MHDDWIDSLRYCAFIGGRHCGKTVLAKELARHLLNSNYGLASADNWAQRYLYTVDKLYDTLGIKDYLNKVYGDPMLKFKNGNYIDYDIDLTKRLFKTPDIVDLINQIEKEEEKNKMADKKKELAKEYGCDLTFDEIFEDYKKEEKKNKTADWNKKGVYTFTTKDFKGNDYEITLEKDFKNTEFPYHARTYTLKDANDRCFARTFGYHYWEQLETQLIYDLASWGINIGQDCRDKITYELHRAKNVFRGRVYANVESPYQGGYVHTITPEIMEFKNGKELTLRKAQPFEVMPKIKKVIFNPPATIVEWKDGTKTIVKCQDNDEFDWEKGLAMAYVKRAFGNERTYYGLFKKNEPFMNLPNSNMKYDPNLAKEVRIIVPKNLPVTGDIIMKAHELIMKEGNKKFENGITLGQ